MIYNGIKECAKANCTFFEENIKHQEFKESWLGRFVTLLDEDGLITNLVRPIFYCFSYFKDASVAIKSWPNQILLTNPESISIEDSIKVLSFSIHKCGKGEFDSIISQLTSKIIATMPEYKEKKNVEIYNYEMSKRLSDLALVSLKNDGWIPNTVLSHLIKQPEFLDCLCRFDLASLLMAQIDDEAKDILMTRLCEQGLPPHISLKLDGVIAHIRHELEDRFPLAYGAVEYGRGRSGPFSSDAIVWLAYGDEKMLLDYIGMFSSDRLWIQFDKEEWRNNIHSNERWNTLFWLAEALKQREDLEAPEAPDWVKTQVALDPDFYGEAVGLWLGGVYGYRHQLKKHRFTKDENKTLPGILANLQLNPDKKSKFDLAHRYMKNSLTRSMILDKLSLEGSIKTCLSTSLAFGSEFLLMGGNTKNYFNELQDEALVKMFTGKLRVTGEHYPSGIVRVLKKNCTTSGIFTDIPSEILTLIWTWLAPDDAGRLSGTCRRLFHFIGGPQGTPVWEAQGLGSIGAVRRMYGLIKIIDHKWTESGRNDPVKREGIQVFLSTLAAAWPEMAYLTNQLQLDLNDFK